MDSVAKTMVVISGLLLVGAFGEFIFSRTRIPDGVWLVAAGVLATIPVHRGIPGMENLAPGIYALIVFSVIFFAAGIGIVGRLHE